MIPHVVEAKHLGGHRVWLKFNDGASGELDLSDELDGPVFEPLRDVEFFSRFVVRYNTLSWENGADFAPEFLRKKLTLSRQSTRTRSKRHAGDATPRS
jgi:Protein of unknown function (DUF2442)